MSAFTTSMLSIVILLSIVAFLYMLIATGKRGPNEGETTGHVWDEDLTEYNKPMPRWWLNLFWLTSIWGIGYLIAYPGLAGYRGFLKWTSDAEVVKAQQAVDQQFNKSYGALARLPVEQLLGHPQAQVVGRSVFVNHCATCHGAQAQGAKGFPNLTDQDWLWGGDANTVMQSILQGRQGAMPPMGAVLGPEGVREVAVYVQSLSGTPADATLTARGHNRFATVCAACHGVEGKGNPLLGAPNLTDQTWLYGGDYNSLLETIEKGRNGQMPAHAPLIGETRAKLVAAWVLAQSQNSASGAKTKMASHE